MQMRLRNNGAFSRRNAWRENIKYEENAVQYTFRNGFDKLCALAVRASILSFSEVWQLESMKRTFLML